MSKTISIQESGLGKTMTVDALQLLQLAGGSKKWLPADGKNLVELDIGGSGTYKASDYNAYGIAVARVTPKYGGGATYKAATAPAPSTQNPSIQEGGEDRIFSASRIKTDLSGGETCEWVCEDDVSLQTKFVNHSGTYPASADGCYGYSQVTVSGVDVEITTDGDGDDVADVTDGGETIEEKLPSEIRIETNPRKMEYFHDEDIDISGMVVKAYTRSGLLWTDKSHPDGVITLNELTISPTKTDISKTDAIFGNEDGVRAKLMTYMQRWNPNDAPSYVTENLGVVDGNNYCLGGSDLSNFLLTKYNGGLYAALIRGNNKFDLVRNYYPNTFAGYYWATAGTTLYFMSDRFTRAAWDAYIQEVPISEADPTGLSPDDLTPETGQQPITVSWARPYDSQQLTTDFYVTVTPRL